MRTYDFQIPDPNNPMPAWSDVPKTKIEFPKWEHVAIAAYTLALVNKVEVRVTKPPYDQGHYFHWQRSEDYFKSLETVNQV